MPLFRRSACGEAVQVLNLFGNFSFRTGYFELAACLET